jgi:aryl-alcohol dehydrogenase-like predicted oxidoreductase
MGDPDDKTDYQMYDSLKQSVLSGGINHIDTAPNYRYMKSERTVGKVLTSLQSKYGIKRDELFVTSKVGYVPEDGTNMISQREMIKQYVEAGVPDSGFTKESGHSLHPTFLRMSVDQSLERLNL